MTRVQSLSMLQRTLIAKLDAADLAIDTDAPVPSAEHIHELATAADRIAEGGYGVCIDCGAEIPLQRLRAKPEAVRCIACQQQVERMRVRRWRDAS